MKRKELIQKKDVLSELTEILAKDSFIRGGLVKMKRVCGKPNCRCAKGEKHVSLYLSCKYKDKRKMIYIPPEKEKEIQECVKNHRKIVKLMEEISDANFERIMGKR